MQGVPWANPSCPILFINVDGAEQRTSGSGGGGGGASSSGAGQGVLIAGVLQNGPAARAGIQPGDVILQVQNQPVRNVAELLRQVAELPPGQTARLSVWRKQNTLVVQVTPGERPRPGQR